MEPQLAASTSPQVGPPPRAGPRRRWWWVPVLLAGALGLAALAVSALSPRPEHAEPSPALRADPTGLVVPQGAPQWEYVKLAVAEEAAALPPLPVPGRVGFDERRTASVGSPLSGRVEEVAARFGDAVKAGQKLFSVRSRDFADLDKEVASAREALEVKKRLRERSKELFELSAVPEKELVSAEAELKEASLALKAAEAKQRSLLVAAGGDNLFWVKAPRAGNVVTLDVLPGQEVTPDRGEPLIRLSDTSEVVVLADVPEMDAVELVPGTEATIRTRDGLERPGTLLHIAAVVDPQRQTVGVRLRAANADHLLKPNAFVEVTLRGKGGPRTVQVDEDAVVSDGTRSVLFVVQGADRLERREVQPGRRRRGVVEIRSGLAAGTRYVSKGALLLLNQMNLAD